jgi:hypothetical protein
MRKSFFRGGLKRTGVRAGACVAALALTSDVYAADCGSLAAKIFGKATITSATSVTPPSSLLGKDPRLPVSIKAPLLSRTGSAQSFG